MPCWTHQFHFAQQVLGREATEVLLVMPLPWFHIVSYKDATREDSIILGPHGVRVWSLRSIKHATNPTGKGTWKWILCKTTFFHRDPLSSNGSGTDNEDKRPSKPGWRFLRAPWSRASSWGSRLAGCCWWPPRRRSRPTCQTCFKVLNLVKSQNPLI